MTILNVELADESVIPKANKWESSWYNIPIEYPFIVNLSYSDLSRTSP